MADHGSILSQRSKGGGPGPRKRPLSPAVEQAARVLFCLADARSTYMSLTDIHTKVGIHKSKAFSILETLRGSGLVRKNSDGKGYMLGPGLVFLSRRVLDLLSPARLAEPVLRDLAAKTGCTAVLGLIDGAHVFAAAKHDAEDDFGVTMRIGQRLPLAYGAHGKAIAAFMPEAERDGLLRGKALYFYGKAGEAQMDRLLEELEACRRDGFAIDPGEINPGLHVVASPVFGPRGAPIGFIEIFVLFSPGRAPKLAPSVAEAARALSRELGANMEGR